MMFTKKYIDFPRVSHRSPVIDNPSVNDTGQER